VPAPPVDVWQGGVGTAKENCDYDRLRRGIDRLLSRIPECETSCRQLDLAGVFERPHIADSPRLKELIGSGAYSKLHEHYHEYELRPEVLCTLGEAGCSVERAYEALKNHAIPGGPMRTTPIENGRQYPVSLGGIPGGHVVAYVEDSTHSIINATHPDHELYDGLVQRRIVVEGDKVVLRTFGIGIPLGIPLLIAAAIVLFVEVGAPASVVRGPNPGTIPTRQPARPAP